MATLTAETIAKLNIDNVLAAYAAEQKAMLAIEAESVVLGVKKADLIKAYNTEAKAVADLAKKQEQAAKGPSEWSIRQKELLTALNETKGEINKTREATGQLAGAIGLLSPQMGALAGGVQKVEGVFGAGAAAAEVLGTSLSTVAVAAAPVGVAIAAVGYAWHEHNIEAEKAKKRLEDAEAQAKETGDAMKGLGAIISENLIKQKELSGEYTATQAAQVRAGKSLADSYIPRLADQAHALEEARKALADYTGSMGSRSLIENTFNNQTATLTANVKAQEAAMGNLNAQYKAAFTGTLQNIQVEGEQKDATEATTKAIKEQKEEIEGLAALLADTEARTKAAAESEKRRQASAAAHWKAERDGIEAAKKADQEYLAAQEQIALAIAHMDNEEKKNKMATAAAWVDAASQAVGALGDIYKRDADAKMAAAKAGDKEAQKAIQKDFRAQQAAAYSGALLDAAAAEINVLATVPFPLSIPASVIVGATAAADIATIKQTPPPTFGDAALPPIGGAGNRTINVHEQDYVAAAKDPTNLMANAERAIGGSGGRSGRGRSWRPRNEETLAYNAVGAIQDIQRLVRG